MVSSAEAAGAVRVLIDSIRSFGGPLSNAQVWVFDTDPHAGLSSGPAAPGVRVLPLNVPETPPGYWLADKVAACARAEALAGPGVKSLVWFDSCCLVLQPPVLLELPPEFDVALRPVHIRNVGLAAEAPLDDYWRRVYEAVGIADTSTVVESFVDAQRIRAYYNTHVAAVNPGRGLFRQWQECFQALLADDGFRAGLDDRHRVFLHQAVFSALVAARIEPARIRALPPDYNYPYNLQGQVPPDRQPRVLNDLTCAVWEGRSLDPGRMTDIEVREPLRAWLAARTPLVSQILDFPLTNPPRGV